MTAVLYLCVVWPLILRSEHTADWTRPFARQHPATVFHV